MRAFVDAGVSFKFAVSGATTAAMTCECSTQTPLPLLIIRSDAPTPPLAAPALPHAPPLPASPPRRSSLVSAGSGAGLSPRLYRQRASFSVSDSSTFPHGAAEMRVYVDGGLVTNITLKNNVLAGAPVTAVLASGLSAAKAYNVTGVGAARSTAVTAPSPQRTRAPPRLRCGPHASAPLSTDAPPGLKLCATVAMLPPNAPCCCDQPCRPARPPSATQFYITDPVTMSWDTLPAVNAQTAHSFSTDGAIDPQPAIAPGAQRRFDIYGDSITAGNQIDPVTCQPDWAGTYGRILCDAFDVQGLRHHFGPHVASISALHHPSRTVCHALLGGYAYGMPIDWCLQSDTVTNSRLLFFSSAGELHLRGHLGQGHLPQLLRQRRHDERARAQAPARRPGHRDDPEVLRRGRPSRGRPHQPGEALSVLMSTHNHGYTVTTFSPAKFCHCHLADASP